MKRIILLSFLLSTFLVMDLLAQDGTWVINGQVRHRYSMDGRDFNGDTGTLNMNELRTLANCIDFHSFLLYSAHFGGGIISSIN